MPIFLIFQTVAAYQLFPKEVCPCSKYATETACLAIKNCDWEKQICIEKPCHQYYNEIDCDKAYQCSWNYSKCQIFTVCEDFGSSDPFNCFQKGMVINEMQCQPSYTNPGQCLTFEYKSCSALKSREECSGYQSFSQLCYWNNNVCEVINIRLCSGLKDQRLCAIFGEGLGCRWNGSKCHNLTCSDFKNQSQCLIQRQDDLITPFTVCKWDTVTNPKEPACVEAESVEHISQFDCYDYTLRTHLWDEASGKCVSCKQLPDAKKSGKLLQETSETLNSSGFVFASLLLAFQLTFF